MSRSLDFDTVLTTVARVGVPSFADRCVVYVGESPSTVESRAACADSSLVALIERATQLSRADQNWEHGLLAPVLRTGQLGYTFNVSEEQLDREAPESELARLMRTLTTQSLIVAPLAARGRTFGAVSFTRARSASARCYDAADLELASDLAKRCALALDNARLYGEARRAEDALRQVDQNRSRELAALQQDRSTLAAALAGMGGGLLIANLDCRVRYCNQRAGEILDLESTTADGRPLASVIDRFCVQLEDPSGARAAFAHAQEHLDRPSDFEVTTVGPPRHHFLVQVFLIADATGTSLGSAILLRDVTAAKLLAILQERDRIAMDLHDGVIQSLYGMTLGLVAAELKMEQRPDEMRQAVRRATGQIDDIIQDIRAYIGDLRHCEIGARGLRAALEAIADEVPDVIPIDVDVRLDQQSDDGLSPDARRQLLQIAREAVANVRRHAVACYARVSLTRTSTRLILTIKDDGRGFDPLAKAPETSFGLRNIRERARMLGGDVSIQSALGRGTEITVTIPAPGQDEVK